MAKGFVSFLDKVGHDFKVGIEKTLPIDEAAAKTIIPSLFPGAAIIFSTVVGVVSQTEQKFAAIGKQSGSGPEKLQEVLGILGPALSQMLTIDGKAADATTVTSVINAVVAFMNAIPAAAGAATGAEGAA